MKKILIFPIALGLVALASCSRDASYEHNSFFSMHSASYNIREDAGELVIPVTVYNPKGEDMAATFNVVDGTAKSGVNYELVSPVSKVLTFTEDATTQNIVIKVKDIEGYKGAVNFSVSIASATEDIPVGILSSASVRIADKDHPYANLLGEYTVKCQDVTGALTYTMNLVADPDDVTVLWCDGIVPRVAGSAYVKAAISQDGATLSFPTGQKAMTEIGGTTPFQLDDGDATLYGCLIENETYYTTREASLTFSKSVSGDNVVFTTESGICLVDDSSIYGGAFLLGKQNGYTTTWTKK